MQDITIIKSFYKIIWLCSGSWWWSALGSWWGLVEGIQGGQNLHQSCLHKNKKQKQQSAKPPISNAKKQI